MGCIRALRLAALLPVLLAAACATPGEPPMDPPVQEMSDARQALQAARSAGGPRHFPETFARALERIQEAEASLSRGDFRQARAAAVSAREQAVAARGAARYIERLE